MIGTSSVTRSTRLNLLAVEPRMLFDGAGAATAIEHDPIGAAECDVMAADLAIFAGDGIDSNGPAAGNVAPLATIDYRDAVIGQSVAGQAVAGGAHGDAADIDGNGDALCVVGVVRGYQDTPSRGNVGDTIDGQYGHLTMQGDGSYVYTPHADLVLAPGESVRDVFTYSIIDGRGGEDSTWIKFDITSDNHNPVANPDHRTLNADLDPVAGNVIRGDRTGERADTDSDGDYLLVTGVAAGDVPDVGRGNLGAALQGQYGVLTLYADGGYHFEPNRNLQIPPGTQVRDVFSYLVCDHKGGEARTTLTFALDGPSRSDPVPPIKPVVDPTSALPAPFIPRPGKPTESNTSEPVSTLQTGKETLSNNASPLFAVPLASTRLGLFSDIRPAALDVPRLEMPRDTFAAFSPERVLGDVQEMAAAPADTALAKPTVVQAQDDSKDADKPVAKLKPKLARPTTLIRPEASGNRSFSDQLGAARKAFVPPAKVRAAQPIPNR